MSTHTFPSSRDQTCRYWVFVYHGEVHQLTWTDGEDRLALACSVHFGTRDPHVFIFLPRGNDAASLRVELAVTTGQPLELLAAYDCSPDVAPSHWFG